MGILAYNTQSYPTHKGLFKPSNPSKYVGNTHSIVYRSSWELLVMQRLDKHPDVLQWASEEFSIPYIDMSKGSPGKMRRYFPDFWIRRKDKAGAIETYVIEVKPKAETRPPERKPHKKQKRYLQEHLTYKRNESKWLAAQEFCRRKGWQFKVWTEETLGLV